MYLIRSTTNVALALLASAAFVNSLPSLSTRDTSPNLVTLPVNRLNNLRVLDDVGIPAQLNHQLHVNLGNIHLARMTGREMPSNAELLHAIRRRMSGVDARDLTPPENATYTGSTGLYIEPQNIGYIAALEIGTPSREFKLLVDSGSSDLWVGGEGCQSPGGTANCGNHTFLGSNSSSSFQSTGKNWSLTYGSGVISGQVIKDNVAIAGFSLNDHTFGVATTESSVFSSNETPFDGILGLAGPALSGQQVPTLVMSLKSAGLISASITSYKLGRDDAAQNDGEITFGGLDPAKYDASSLVTVSNADSNGFWAVNIDGVSVDGTNLNISNRTAILDTGTSLVLAPSSDANAMLTQIPGSYYSNTTSSWLIPCNTTSSVSLSIGGRDFSISSADLIFDRLSSDPNGFCTTGITSGSVGGQWLMGDVFLRNVYYSTNLDTNQISLADLS